MNGSSARTPSHPDRFSVPKRLSAKYPSDEDELLKFCEREVSEWIKGSFRAGYALLIIKTKELYLKSHESWEEYCLDRWNISRFYAHRLMAAAEIATALLTNGNIPPPKTEAQVRPLVGIDPKLRNEIWQRAVKDAGGRPVTSDLVRTAAAKVTGIQERDSHCSHHRRQIASSKDELLKWVDKAKLFIEQGYGDSVRNTLKDVLFSIERHPELIAREFSTEDDQVCDPGRSERSDVCDYLRGL